MVVTVNKMPPIYTVKFSKAVGDVDLKDYSATGTSDAEDQWRKEFPDATLITIFRKS